MNLKTSRKPYIDFLKMIGLTGIIIAHVNAPNWVMMLRSFDVSLMVIISSILGNMSYEKEKNIGIVSVSKYWLKRIKRLVIPVWIFLILFFLTLALNDEMYFPIEYYLYSFCLTRYGIGYVWVILIYI